MSVCGVLILAATATVSGAGLEPFTEKKEIVEIISQVLQDRGLSSDLLHEIQDLKGEITDLKVEITDLKGEITDLKVENTALKAENTVLKREIANLKWTVTKDMRQELVALKIKNQQQISEMKSEISQLKTEGLDQNLNQASFKNEESMEIIYQDELEKDLKADIWNEENQPEVEIQSNKGPANVFDNKTNSNHNYPKTLQEVLKEEPTKTRKTSEGINTDGHGIDRLQKEPDDQYQDELNQSKVTRLKRHANTSHVAFSAYLGHDILHMSPGHTIKCDQIILNDGNGYNANTGVFTARVTGVYLFHFSISIHDGRWVAVKMVIDNRNIVDAIVTSYSRDKMGGNTIIVQVNENESVWLEAYASPDGEAISKPTYRFTTFSGVLLYAN